MTTTVSPYARDQRQRALFNPAVDEVRLLLLDSTSTALAEILTAATVAEVTTLGEFDGVGYAQKAVSGITVDLNAPGDVVVDNAPEVDFGVISPGTNPIAFSMLIIWKGTLSASIIWVVSNDSTPAALYPFVPGALPTVVNFPNGLTTSVNA